MRRQHPIRKMREAEARCGTIQARERSLARHVKPLLDALEREHKQGWRDRESDRCKVCRFLAEWRAKL